MKSSPDPHRAQRAPGAQIGPAPRDEALRAEVERMRAAGFDVIGAEHYRQLVAAGVDPTELRRFA